MGKTVDTDPWVNQCLEFVPSWSGIILSGRDSQWESDGNPDHRNFTCLPGCYGSGWKKDAVNLAALRKQMPRSGVDHSQIFFSSFFFHGVFRH